MLSSRSFLLTAPLLFFSQFLHAATYSSISFDETISQSENIVIGVVDKIEYHNSTDKDLKSPDLRLSDIDLFTIITFSNAQQVMANETVSILEKFVVYVDGGVIPMPPAFKYKYTDAKYFGQGNTSVPHTELKAGAKLIMFLEGNGRYDSPFLGPYGVLTIQKDDTVSLQGAPVIGIEFMGGLETHQHRDQNVPLRAEGPIPPAHVIAKLEENKLNNFRTPLSTFELIEYVQKIKKATAGKTGFSKTPLVPISLSESFQKKEY